jgi:sporulation protein YlmC with PRC-barrel domain
MYQRTNIRRGMAVMSYDGVQVGRVVDVNADGIVIEKGQFFLRDFRVPFSDISVVRGDDLVLVRDHAALRVADTDTSEHHTRDDVGIAGIAAPPPQGGLGLGPTDLTRARMDSAKFQDHGQYDMRTFREGGEPLPPDPLTEARMDSAKFQDHRLYDVGTASTPAREETPTMPPPMREPAMAERRAAGPGWDPLSVDEDEGEEKVPRTSGPDTEPPTRY